MELYKISFWEALKRFFWPLKNNKKHAAKALICFILWWLYNVFIAFSIKELTVKIQNHDVQAFYNILIVLWLWLLIYQLVNLLTLRWWYLDYVIQENLNKELLPKFFHIENNYYEKIWTGKTISIIQRWVDAWSNWALEYLMSLPTSIISLIMAVYIISIINYKYLLIFVVAMVILAIFIHKIQKKWYYYRQLRTETEAQYTRHFIRNIMSKFEIIQSNKIGREIISLNIKLNNILEMDKKKHLYEHITYNIWDFTTNVVRLVLMLFVWTRIIEWVANYSDLILVITVIWYFEKSLQEVTNLYKRTIKHFPNIEKLWDFIDNSPKINNINIWEDFEYKKWDFEIKNVSFSYNEKVKIFDNFSMKIIWWTKTAFVWESGWWKTTLIKLLAWYTKINSWTILIDWQNLDEIKLTDYYKNIWYLTQDPSIFDWTIHENLTYALNKEPPEDDIKKAIINAKCEFVNEFHQWLQTEIWERWVRLSWGQKQRLAIAKIMLKNPNIILLDEPTSALDSFNEEQINIALNNLFKWRTVVIIAHRLQTVKQADLILLFEKWKIIESWNHQELIKYWWKYKRMLDLQSWF